jgi:low temperature requirement protein LtrA
VSAPTQSQCLPSSGISRSGVAICGILVTWRRVSRYLRQARPDEEQHASNLELFYDLVFVFAVTQVSHLLLNDLTWHGAGRALLVLLVVWWAWNYTTWVTNQLDPDAVPVRLLVLAIMLASLVLAIAIPEAFGSRALLFAGAYVAIQVGRHLFLTFVVADRHSPERVPALHILTWFLAAGIFWIAGGLASGATQIGLWLAALAIDYSAPLFLYRVPGRPKLSPSSWQVETSHFAERFQLFIIIALGESIVITGATTAELTLDAARMAAFALAFVSTAALWWLYFSYVARIAERRLELSEDRTTTARDAFTYLHVLFVAGIIVAAVGDELVIAHPTEELPTPELVAVVAGPVVYLLAHVLFRLRLARSLSWRRLGAAAACIVIGLAGTAMPALVVAALIVALLVVLIAWEDQAARLRRRRGEPSPLEQLGAGG